MKTYIFNLITTLIVLSSVITFVKSDGDESDTAYESRGPCQYCKYCTFCDDCQHCPCETKGPDDLPYCEYCSYCKYCTYCKLCDYCQDGGALSRLTKSVADLADSVLQLFSIGDRTLASEAQKQFKDSDAGNDDRLSKEKLSKIDRAYKEKLEKPEL